jgi:hypothetical protein
MAKSQRMVEIDKFLLVEGAPNVIRIFSHVGWFHDLGIMWAPQNNNKIVYYSYIQIDTWKFGWSYTNCIIHMDH